MRGFAGRYLIYAGALAVLAAGSAARAGRPPGNSSKECAICHIRWADAFTGNEPSTEPMEGIMERQAGSGDMCLSCHDGSVVDSRFKVWSTMHHTTDAKPSPKVNIPTDIFPLDDQGRMTCATCHTAHAVEQSSDIRTVVFLRQPNVDSSLCLSCHPEHAVKDDCQHPLGEADKQIPQVILDAGGKTSDNGRTVICQTCHEPHGAENAAMLVLPPSQLCVACHTDKAAEIRPPAGAPAHRMGHTYEGFTPPESLLKERAVFGKGNELTCLSCHRLHDASGARPLLIRNNQDSSLCMQCHDEEKAIIGSSHDLRVSSPDTVNAAGLKASESGPCGACHRIHGWARDVPDSHRPHSSGCMECHQTGGPGATNRLYEESHPVGITMPEGMHSSLPLDKATGKIGCLTCHEPHSPRADADPMHVDPDSNVQAPRSFLREEGSTLCVACHERAAQSLEGPHNPAGFTAQRRRELGLHSSIGSCRLCHSTHSAKGPYLWTQPPTTGSGSSVADLCNACHDGRSIKGPLGTHHPLEDVRFEHKLPPGTPMEPTLELGIPQIGCAGCHDPHGGAANGAQLRRPVKQLCLHCHEDKAGMQGSVHDPESAEWARDMGLNSPNLCMDCHPIHGIAGTSGVWKHLGPMVMGGDEPCESCHRAVAPEKVVETAHLAPDVTTDPNHPIGLVLAEDRGLRCVTCHDIHHKSQNAVLLRMDRSKSQLCLECHSQFSTVLGTPHDLSAASPDTRNSRAESAVEAGACSGCHLVHAAGPRKSVWAHGTLKNGDFGVSLCTVCHNSRDCGAERMVEHIDHPQVEILNRIPPESPEYMPTFDKSGQVSVTGAIACRTCHEPHAATRRHTIHRATGSSLSHDRFLRTGTGQRLCVDCHGLESPWRYLHFHRDTRNPHGGRE